MPQLVKRSKPFSLRSEVLIQNNYRTSVCVAAQSVKILRDISLHHQYAVLLKQPDYIADAA